MGKPTRLSRRAVQALLAVVLLAVAGCAAWLNLAGSQAKAPLAMPALFSDADAATVDRLASGPRTRADLMAARWLAKHPGRADAAFQRYALQTVGPPPPAAQQRRELAQLHRIGGHRTAAGLVAASWLEQRGKKDVWKAYTKQYAQFAPKPEGARDKKMFKAAYALANAIETAGKAQFARPSPYQADPSLRAPNQAKYAGQIRYSYPSKHALIGSAEQTILSRVEPHRAHEFSWMLDEIAYSRMYAAGHYPSDIAAGIYLGRLVADYELAVSPPS